MFTAAAAGEQDRFVAQRPQPCLEPTQAHADGSGKGQLVDLVVGLAGRPQLHHVGIRDLVCVATHLVDEAPEIELGPRVSREFDPGAVDSAEPFPPWSGVQTLPAERLRAVRDFVAADFGGVIGGHAPSLMQRLYYLKFQDKPALASTLGLNLRNGDARYAFALDYGHLEFTELPPGARPAAVGLELWASDLELMLHAEEDAYMIAESGVRTWSHAAELIDSPALLEALLWFTPRFRPHEHLRHYRARIAELRGQSEARRA